MAEPPYRSRINGGLAAAEPAADGGERAAESHVDAASSDHRSRPGRAASAASDVMDDAAGVPRGSAQRCPKPSSTKSLSWSTRPMVVARTHPFGSFSSSSSVPRIIRRVRDMGPINKQCSQNGAHGTQQIILFEQQAFSKMQEKRQAHGIADQAPSIRLSQQFKGFHSQVSYLFQTSLMH